MSMYRGYFALHSVDPNGGLLIRPQEGFERRQQLLDRYEHGVRPVVMTIGDRINLTILNRSNFRGLVVGAGFGNHLLDPILGNQYVYDDPLDEMATVNVAGLRMNDFYRIIATEAAEDMPKCTCRIVQIGSQDATDKVAPFGTQSGFVGSTEWWLHGPHEVNVTGSITICKTDTGLIRLIRVRTDWEWHDEIDAKAFWEQDGGNLVGGAIEGSWDILQDRVRGVWFPIVIKWQDEWHGDVLIGAGVPRTTKSRLP